MEGCRWIWRQLCWQRTPVRGETPSNYMVMVGAGNVLLNGVASRAQELLLRLTGRAGEPRAR